MVASWICVGVSFPLYITVYNTLKKDFTFLISSTILDRCAHPKTIATISFQRPGLGNNLTTWAITSLLSRHFFFIFVMKQFCQNKFRTNSFFLKCQVFLHSETAMQSHEASPTKQVFILLHSCTTWQDPQSWEATKKITIVPVRAVSKFGKHSNFHTLTGENERNTPRLLLVALQAGRCLKDDGEQQVFSCSAVGLGTCKQFSLFLSVILDLLGKKVSQS